jgi:hypothetical protein
MIDMVDYTEIFELEDGLIFTGYGKNRKSLKRFVFPDYNLGYVFGSYLSIGTANISIHNGTKRGLVFWYVKSDLEPFIVNLQSSINLSFGLNVKIRERGGNKTSPRQVVCYSKPLATLLKNLGSRSGNKKLPNNLFFTESKDFVKGLIASIENFEGFKPDARKIPNKRKLNIEVIMLYNSLKNY